jgi:meiotic recombination protein SPO11
MAQPLATGYLGGEDSRESTVRAYIDNTLTALVHELSLSPVEARPSITLKRRANPTACIINPDNGALEASPRVETYKTYSWPGKTAFEAWKFSMIFFPSAGTNLHPWKNVLIRSVIMF